LIWLINLKTDLRAQNPRYLECMKKENCGAFGEITSKSGRSTWTQGNDDLKEVEADVSVLSRMIFTVEAMTLRRSH